MAQIVTLLNEENADEVTKALSNFDENDVEWDIIRHDPDVDRILPAGIPQGEMGPTGTGPVGIYQNDAPAEMRVDDLGLDPDEEEFFAQGLNNGAMVLVIDYSDEYEAQIESILAEANATRYAES